MSDGPRPLHRIMHAHAKKKNFATENQSQFLKLHDADQELDLEVKYTKLIPISVIKLGIVKGEFPSCPLWCLPCLKHGLCTFPLRTLKAWKNSLWIYGRRVSRVSPPALNDKWRSRIKSKQATFNAITIDPPSLTLMIWEDFNHLIIIKSCVQLTK